MSDSKKSEPVPCSCGERHDIDKGQVVRCRCGATLRKKRIGDIGWCVSIAR